MASSPARYIDPPSRAAEESERPDSLTLGRRIRHARTRADLTLAQLAERVGTSAAQLSHIENGRREPRLTLLQAIAGALGTSAGDLLTDEPPPDRRAQLEIALARAQRSSTYRALGAPEVHPTKSVPTDVLASLVALHDELDRRDRESVATPEEARRANTELRLHMQRIDNYVPELEEIAETRHP